MCGTANITIKNGSLVNTVSKDGSDVTPSIAHTLDISGGTVALEKVELTSGRGQDGKYTSALHISGGSLTVTGSTAPDLSRPEADKDYKAEGLIGAETLSSTVTLSCAQTPDMSKTGTTSINITGTLSNGNYHICSWNTDRFQSAFQQWRRFLLRWFVRRQFRQFWSVHEK